MAQSIVKDIDTSSPIINKIKVIGVGGGGGNAVQKMISAGLQGVQFACANTDLQHLKKMDAPVKIQLGEKLTNGLGAGAIPAVGQDAAIESKTAIRDALADADMVFVTAGMGGGTGTGAAPVIAQLAKELGALTVGIVTKPFTFEGSKRMKAAEEGLENLKQHVDCLITVPNDRLVAFAPKKTPFRELLQKANDVLFYAVKGISDLILGDGDINLDFADVRTIMSESGLALMGTGIASGENRAREATQRAIMSPLLEDVSLESAKAVLYNITASMDISGEEITEIGNIIAEAMPSDTRIIFGVLFDESAGDEIRVTVIATGIEPAVPVKQNPATVTQFSPSQNPAAKVQQRPFPPQDADYPHTEQNARRGGASSLRGSSRPRQEQIATWIGESNGHRPSYQTKQDVLDANKGGRHNPGHEEWHFSEDEFEIPAFIRMQAD
ncbi:MAG: cell division protein FtsZ [Desulfovibrio sp.]|jgi:cell division protein FtsZ|nr:cell division protein FtsZ [Desulfovibrio sp.]